MSTINLPSTEGVAKRQLHMFYVLDISGSMQGAKIQALNHAMEETIPAMREAAKGNLEAEVLVRVLTFSDNANWLVVKPTKVDDFNWTPINNADGVTDMGTALSMLADALEETKFPHRMMQPVILLLSDGQPTDDFDSGLKKLMDKGWGKKSLRLAIAMGEDADLAVLQKFIGNPERKPLVASNALQLVKYIKWASTQVTSSIAKPPSKPKDAAASASDLAIPQPSSDVGPVSPSEEWD